jgi:c-di-GMP-binding flagellar brake protein YcgR
MWIRRRADREFLELVERKTGLKPAQLVVRARRRRVVRHLCKAVLTLEADALGADEAAGTRIETRVLDLSESGASFFSQQELAAGQRCAVAIRIIEGGTVETQAEVRWASYKNAKDGYAVGVCFVGLDDANAKRLEAFLSNLEATLGL